MARFRKDVAAQVDPVDVLFDAAPVGLAVYDLSARYVRVNAALAAMHGVAVEDHAGRSVEELVPEIPDAHETVRLVIATGEPVSREATGRTRADPGTDRRWITSYFPLADENGTLVGVGGAVIDVTARRGAERALRRSHDEHRFLAEAGSLLAGSLDLNATLESIADLAVPAMADWCAVDLVDEQGRARNVALAHADPAEIELARRLPYFSPGGRRDSAPPVARVIATGRHELHSDAGPELLGQAARDPAEREAWRALGVTSALIVPMVARGRTIGAISFVTSRSGPTVDDGDVVFAERVAGHCALAVDNARLFGERTEAARELQESLLPPEIPDVPGFEVAARYQPAGMGSDVGGDFYDVFPVGPDSWLLAIGDVQGKGPRAAAVTGLARYTIRAAAIRGADTGGVMNALNEALLREEVGQRFLTLVYATLDLTGSVPRLLVANAGHPLPLVLRADGRVEGLGDHGLLLGVAPDLRLAETPLDLAPGDMLVLYTDGVIEARAADGGQFGEQGLADLLATCAGYDAAQVAGRVLAAATAESGQTRDDVAVLAVRRR